MQPLRYRAAASDQAKAAAEVETLGGSHIYVVPAQSADHLNAVQESQPRYRGTPWLQFHAPTAAAAS